MQALSQTLPEFAGTRRRKLIRWWQGGRVAERQGGRVEEWQGGWVVGSVAVFLPQGTGTRELPPNS